MTGITERIERGTALLDEKRPGWWHEIDLELLDIDSRCGCILGQLGDKTFQCRTPAEMYVNGLYLVRLDNDRQASACGFDAETSVDDLCDRIGDTEAMRLLEEEFTALTAAWRDLITRRRALS